MVQLKSKSATVDIDAGELVSFLVDGHEFIHQKGSPGWRNADTEMFPIIGPVNEAGYHVQVPRGNAVQDQHGLLRELEYQLISQAGDAAVFVKKYQAGTPVNNSKYPEKSPKPRLMWPYGFGFEKSFLLKGNTLEISFIISGERDMPFMLGYHPAFKLYTKTPTLVANDREISLDEVLDVGSRAYQVKDCTRITLKDERELTIETEGFGQFMCWTEVRNMICIEPISFYPYSVNQRELYLGFQHLKDTDAVFKVRITA